MIIGTGFDIVEVARIEKASQNELFLIKNFTREEVKMFEARKHRAEMTAGNFAAKEAVLKALGCGIFDIALCEIEVLREKSGKPYVTLYGKAKDRSEELGIKQVHISISHTDGFAAAQAVAEGE